jgi:hypothetical protein
MIANPPIVAKLDTSTTVISAIVRCQTLMSELNAALEALHNEGHSVIVSVTTSYRKPRVDALPSVQLTVDQMPHMRDK